LTRQPTLMSTLRYGDERPHGSRLVAIDGAPAHSGFDRFVGVAAIRAMDHVKELNLAEDCVA